MVMASAFVASVRELYPDSVVDVIVKKELNGIASLIPGIHKVFSFSKAEYKGLKGAFDFGKRLREEKYDLLFNLPASLSSLAMARATRAKKRVGFAKESGFFLLTNAYKIPADMHRVDEYISLLERFTGKRITNREVRLRAATSSPVAARRVLINFNSEASSRRMPLDKARAIANRLISSFGNTTFTFIGSPKEAAFVEEVISGVEDTRRIENMAGKTDLAGLSTLMASSAALLSTDSGPAHLANGLGVPVTVLFGAGNEHNTAPYNKQTLTVLRYGKLPCEPCIKNTCKLYGIPKCMELLDELQIIDALQPYCS